MLGKFGYSEDVKMTAIEYDKDGQDSFWIGGISATKGMFEAIGDEVLGDSYSVPFIGKYNILDATPLWLYAFTW